MNGLRIIDLEEGRPAADEAVKRLAMEIGQARRQKCTALKVIHGYGSSGKGGRIRTEHLPESLARSEQETPAGGEPLPPGCATLAMIKRRAAMEALARHDGRVMAACRELGITKDTLRRILGRAPLSSLG